MISISFILEYQYQVNAKGNTKSIFNHEFFNSLYWIVLLMILLSGYMNDDVKFCSVLPILSVLRLVEIVVF